MFMRNIVRKAVSFIANLWYRIEVTGKENITGDHVVIMSNHSHLMDPLIISASFPGPATAIAKESLFKIPVVGWAVRQLGALPVKRDGSDIKALRDAVKVLQESSLLIFVEGTRNKGSAPLEAKPGSVMIAKMAKAAILPVTIKSNYGFMARTLVHYHPAVYLESFGIKKFSSEDYQRIAADVLKDIYEKKAQL